MESINQSIELLLRQYPRRSQAQWRGSQISAQVILRGSKFIQTNRYLHSTELLFRLNELQLLRVE